MRLQIHGTVSGLDHGGDELDSADCQVIVIVDCRDEEHGEELARKVINGGLDVSEIACDGCSHPVDDCDCNDAADEPIDIQLAHLAKVCGRGDFCTSADGYVCWSWSGAKETIAELEADLDTYRRIANAETAEADKWRLRCFAALQFVPDGVTVGELQTTEAEMRAERDGLREKLEVARENLKAIVDLWYEPSSLTDLGAAVKMGETARDALAKIDAPADTQRGE